MTRERELEETNRDLLVGEGPLTAVVVGHLCLEQHAGDVVAGVLHDVGDHIEEQQRHFLRRSQRVGRCLGNAVVGSGERPIRELA